MLDINPQWARPDTPPPTKQQLREWKYAALHHAPPPGTRITANSRTSNLGVIGFETDDDETTQQVLNELTTVLLALKRSKYPDLVWNATEEHYRTRWTRYQMIGDR